jgi:hypothetical protein
MLRIPPYSPIHPIRSRSVVSISNQSANRATQLKIKKPFLNPYPLNLVAQGAVFFGPPGVGSKSQNGLAGKIRLIEGFALGDNCRKEPSLVLFHEFLKDGVGPGRPHIEHGDEDPIGNGIFIAKFPSDIQEHGEALYGTHTGLNGDKEKIRCHHGVVGEDAETGWAVEDDVPIFPFQMRQGTP